LDLDLVVFVLDCVLDLVFVLDLVLGLTLDAVVICDFLYMPHLLVLFLSSLIIQTLPSPPFFLVPTAYSVADADGDGRIVFDIFIILLIDKLII
jgi:hypothetical protein